MPWTLRSVFHWKYSNWAIAVFGGAALSAAFADKFVAAYAFLAVAAVYSAGCWLTSDTLAKKRRSVALYGPDNKRFGAAARVSRAWRFIPTACILVLFGLIGYWIRGIQVDKELESLHGWLYPGSEVDPHTCGPTPDDTVTMYLGEVTSIVKWFPHTVLRVRGKDRITVNRRKDGAMAVSLDVFSLDGRIVASINENEIQINPNNYFMKKRTRNTLLVLDQQKRPILSVVYLNPKAFKVDAMLFYPDFGPVTLWGLSHVCSGYSVVDISVQ